MIRSLVNDVHFLLLDYSLSYCQNQVKCAMAKRGPKRGTRDRDTRMHPKTDQARH